MAFDRTDECALYELAQGSIFFRLVRALVLEILAVHPLRGELAFSSALVASRLPRDMSSEVLLKLVQVGGGSLTEYGAMCVCVCVSPEIVSSWIILRF